MPICMVPIATYNCVSRVVQLALKTLLGHYSSHYSLWNLKRLAGQLIWGVKALDRSALSALAYSVDVEQTIEDSLVSCCCCCCCLFLHVNYRICSVSLSARRTMDTNATVPLTTQISTAERQVNFIYIISCELMF